MLEDLLCWPCKAQLQSAVTLVGGIVGRRASALRISLRVKQFLCHLYSKTVKKQTKHFVRKSTALNAEEIKHWDRIIDFDRRWI
jgi:hypothetical protein